MAVHQAHLVILEMIKPVRSRSDLEQAQERLACSIKENHDGSLTDEIDVLATLIEQYERDVFPMSKGSPIEAIRFRMHQQGLSPRQLEPFIGPRSRVSEVLSGKRQLTLEMIRSLHEGLGIPYDSLIAKNVDHPQPIKDRWVAVQQLKSLGFNLEPDQIPAFIKSVRTPISPNALHRRSITKRTVSKTDQNALLLWQAAVMKKSGTSRQPFAHQNFSAEKLRLIARLSSRPDGPRRALAALADMGVSVVILQALPGTYLDGAVMARADGSPVMGLTLRHDRVDNFWFTLLHEASHIALHYERLMETGDAFVDDLEIPSEDALEMEADALARESLMPKHLMAHVHWGEASSHDDIIALSVRARVHVSIAAGRWQRDHQNYKKFARLIDRGSLRPMLQVD